MNSLFDPATQNVKNGSDVIGEAKSAVPFVSSGQGEGHTSYPWKLRVLEL
jgi:hypothetical protein